MAQSPSPPKHISEFGQEPYPIQSLIARPLPKDIISRPVQKPKPNKLVKNCLCKSKLVKSERGTCLLKFTDANVKNQLNTIPPKKTNKAPITGPKETEIGELSKNSE